MPQTLVVINCRSCAAETRSKALTGDALKEDPDEAGNKTVGTQVRRYYVFPNL